MDDLKTIKEFLVTLLKGLPADEVDRSARAQGSSGKEVLDGIKNMIAGCDRIEEKLNEQSSNS